MSKSKKIRSNPNAVTPQRRLATSTIRQDRIGLLLTAPRLSASQLAVVKKPTPLSSSTLQKTTSLSNHPMQSLIDNSILPEIPVQYRDILSYSLFSQQKEKITSLIGFFKDKLKTKNKKLSKLEIREYKHLDLYPQKEFVFSFYTDALTPEEAGILYEELAHMFYETLSVNNPPLKGRACESKPQLTRRRTEDFEGS